MPSTDRVYVVKGYSAQYTDPIVVHSGERVDIERQDDQFPGWWWCRASDGRQGWIPDVVLEIQGQRGIALRNYDAQELSVESGEEVRFVEARNGWVRVANAEGRTGWVPEYCLEGRSSRDGS